MMEKTQTAPQDTRIASFRAYTWISVISCLQIVKAIFGIIGVSIWIYLVDQKKDPKIHEGDRELANIMSIVFVVLAAIDLALAILLIIGNKKEKLGLLWAWLLLTVASALLGITSGVVSIAVGVLYYSVGMFISTIIIGGISAFMTYIVHRRVQDIKKERQVRPEKIHL